MERFRNITIIFVLAVGLLNCTALAKPASVLLQEGLYAEEVDGDIDAAIKIYERIIADKSAQKSHVAQALYRQGMCYLKKRDEQQAREVFAKLVADYGDQTDIIEKAKPFLEDLTDADPAALMPPETLVYVELGRPGRQIETILNMLKGTPFENPLAAIGGGPGPGVQFGWSPDQKSPGDILAALMNPSMMAEFKKVRGMGAGITGITQNEPSIVVVLFPGKSDMLRGLVQAGIGVAGMQVQPIEGMTTVAFSDGGGAAYDDTTVILASPAAYSAGHLTRSVKQYKALAEGPTLASSNKSFAKVSKKARQENALTIWANVDEVFANAPRMFQFSQGVLPPALRVADGFLDFGNIDDLITSLSIQKNSIVLETNVAFKDGHRCLAYDLIRTPNLSRAGFEAVPPGAIGMVSFALGQAESAQAEAASQRIRNITGLDIGREIFANIEQVTLFALPPDGASGQGTTWLPPVANSIGLAVTSHDPQQTRQILTQVLTVANLIAAESMGEQPEQAVGRYQIGLVSGQKLYCYMDQGNKTTVLSLNPDVVEASISAIKERRSVYTAGPLQPVVAKLSPTASKAVLVNLGGAIRVAATNMKVGPGDAENSSYQLFDQLAGAFEGTTVQLLTDEKLNNLNIHASISGLPAVNEIFGPMMQMMQVAQGFGGPRVGGRTRGQGPERHASIRKTSQPPVIDGKVEDLWLEAQKYRISNSIYSPASSPEDLSANYRVMCDQENLYLLVEVIDDELKNDSVEFYYDDGVELFIDADNSKDSDYGSNDYTFNFNWDRTNPSMEERGQPYHNDGVKYALVTSDNGYRLEVKFPWSTLGTKASIGTQIGLDVHVNDDDDGGERDTKFTWQDREDNAWQNPGAFGTAEVAGLVGWWKLDETEGHDASDSSGNDQTGRLVGAPKWRPSGGKVGGALEFDGEDDYVQTDCAADLPVWTVAVWAKSLNAPSSEMPSGPVARERNYQINWNHVTDDFRGAAGVSVGGEWHAASFGDLQANTWYHLAATYDGENLKAYKNGVLVTDNSGPSGSADSEIETAKFGRHARDDNFFAGTIDDVRIYNYALSERDISALSKE